MSARFPDSPTEINPLEPAAQNTSPRSRFNFFRPSILQNNDKSLSSVELPFLAEQAAGGYNRGNGRDSPSDGRSSRITKTSIFKTDEHRLKHSILRGSKGKKIGEIIFHFVISLIAIIFLVMPVLSYNLDGEEVDEEGDNGKRIMNLIQYGPTIFPIIFAAITGHFLRSIALRLAEKGTTLETLEQLTRSITIASTITTPYLLNSYNFLSLVLLFLWAISPLGGQASLRILKTAFVPVETSVETFYLDPFNQSSFVEIGLDVGLALAESNNIYVSSLLSSAEVKHSPVDSWRNIKIPFLEVFEQNSSMPQAERGWYDVPKNSNVTYSSLLGTPISYRSTNFTATIEAGYATINCSRLELVRASICDSGRTNVCFNTTNERIGDWSFAWSPGDDTSGPAQYIETGFNLTQIELGLPYDRTTPMDLIFQSRGSGGVSVARCVLSQTFVEAKVDCVNNDCRASRVRRLDQGPKRPYIFVDMPMFSIFNFFRFFARVAPPGHVGYSNPSQLYILDPDNPLSQQTDWLDVSDAGKENFGIRMTQLFNTFLSSTFGGGLYLGSVTIGPNAQRGVGLPVGIKSTKGTSTVLKHVYVVQKTWAAITVLASILLLAMGMAAAAIGFFTLAPDILTSLSALANESQWFDTYKEGTTLDGDDKAVALKRRIVKLGDVRRFEEVGYIALGTIDTELVGVGGLSTDRCYR